MQSITLPFVIKCFLLLGICIQHQVYIALKPWKPEAIGKKYRKDAVKERGKHFQ